MQRIITGIIISYLVGSIPVAYIFGRLLKGIDIRKYGSGNVGATNALRVLGKGPGIAVLLLDVLKGLIVVTLVGNFVITRVANVSEEQLRIALGIFAIIGHNWTVFLGFKGGKGIATTLGVLVGLACVFRGLTVIILLVVAAWFLIFLLFRIVSLASILAGVSLPLLMLLFNRSTTLFFTSIVLAVFVIFRHKANLTRLLQGKEPRLSFKKQV